MDVREKLVELIESARYWGSNTSEEIADYLIAQGVTVQEWISVKDRLPKCKDGKFFVFTQYGYGICEMTRNGRWKGPHSNWITHWAYLPPPPETEYGYFQNVMTNADKIRSMSDEEITEFVCRNGINTLCDIICGGECNAIASFKKSGDEACKEIVMKWLQQPSEVDYD